MRLSLPALFALLCLLLVFVSSVFSEETGPGIFKEYGCNKCHSVKADGMVIVESEPEEDEDEDDDDDDVESPDLSATGLNRDGKWIVKYLRKKIDIEGRKHKKRFKGDKKEFKILRDWLLTLKTPVENETEKKSQADGTPAD